MDNKTMLALRLEGPLQAWGENAKWDYRDSASMPTKSGIVGLIGCAMGLERGNKKLCELNDAITIAVRADRPGTRTEDFQSITGNPLMTANGTPRQGGNTITTKKVYLQDACFTVFVETTPEWHKVIAKALQSPKWCLSLGRRNCIPSRPVLECVDLGYPTLMDAVYNYPAAERSQYPMVYETERLEENKVAILRSDVLAEANREFAMRQVWHGIIDTPTSKEELEETKERAEGNVSD